MTWKNGDEYEGNFNMNAREGYGTFTTTGGMAY